MAYQIQRPIRRRVVAFSDKAESHRLGVKIDELVAARITGGQLSGELRLWIEELPPPLRDRLASLDLVDKSTMMSVKPLAKSLVEYTDASSAARAR